MKIFIAHSSGFDFKNKLYVPIRNSILDKEHNIFLPQESEKEEITIDMIKEIDVLVAEVSFPSLGAGIEMGWANALGIPVIAIFEKGRKVSFSINNVVRERFEYEDEKDMIEKLRTSILRVV